MSAQFLIRTMWDCLTTLLRMKLDRLQFTECGVNNMKIYIDSKHHCHTTNPDAVFREVETDFFDGKCTEFIEGHCYEIKENSTAIYPWKPYNELAAAQVQYELDQAALQAAYEEGVNSV